MNQNRAKYLSWLAIVLSATTLTAKADQLDDIMRRGELVCGVLGTDEPFSYMKDPSTREIVGYDVDLCNTVARGLGVKATLKQISAAARIPELQQGRVDLIAASLTHNKERESQIDFSVSTFISGQKAMVRRDSGIRKLADIDGKRVLTIKGSTMEANIAAKLKGAQTISFDTNPQALLALQQGRGVAYVNDETSLVGNLAKIGSDAKDYVLLPEYFSKEHIALGIRKNEPRLKAKVDKILIGMEASGEAQKAYEKWFGTGTKINLPVRSFKIETDKIDD
ncbi:MULTISPECIES: ABC transporter substrate-binding protein [Pandoraea]|uniref:ABC transporter substrate-binding protein n=1 Tax=Pandoraea TaxID=93217 RepID=UPI001F5E32E7|nr:MULTISPECIES: ABC transporter substrate-binding protein [Pandoraea]MCI3208638.1 amino acid ABC transporter substrate-binding protein [Pandoraea sp. LA3]MDN4586667.1 amino acid ABC transporter substrate-binding protein [Pandoraea capi]